MGTIEIETKNTCYIHKNSYQTYQEDGVNKQMLSKIIITVCLLHRLSAHPPPPPNIISPWRHAPDADNVRRNPRAYAPRPESVMNKSWDGRVHTDCVDSSMVALTFDDGVKYPCCYIV